MWSRIIDSNFNRASEAIKTLEDIIRFELEEIELANNLKTKRNIINIKNQYTLFLILKILFISNQQ